MHNRAPVMENETHKLFFEIQMDPLILARRPEIIITNKRKRIRRIVDFAVPADDRVKLKESKMKEKYIDATREWEKKNCGTWK